MVIWFTPYFISWFAAGGFVSLFTMESWVALLVQIALFLLLSATWTFLLGPKIIYWIGIEHLKTKVKPVIEKLINK